MNFKNRISLLVLVFCFLFSIAQESQTDLHKIEHFKNALKQTTGASRLKLIDSLEKYINYDESLKYDSLMNYATRYALSIDSLNKAGEYASNRIYHQTSILSHPEKGKEVFQHFEPYIPKLNNGKSITRLYLNVADSYYFLRESDTALKYYTLAEQSAIKYKQDHLLGFVTLYRGELNSDRGNFTDAVFDYQKALSQFEKQKDTFNIIGSLNALAVIFAKNEFFEEAQEYRSQSQFLAEQTNSYGSLSALYYNAAEDYNLMGDQIARIASLKKAAQYTRISKYKESMEPPVLAALVAAYADNDSIEIAKKYYTKLLQAPEYYREVPNKITFVYATLSLQKALGNYTQALTAARAYEELALESNSFFDRYLSKLKIAEILEELDRTAEAKDYRLDYYKLKDSISSVKKLQSLTYYQTLYETEKKENLIAAQQKDIELLNTKTKLQRQLFIFGILIALGILTIVFSLRSRRRAKEKARIQEAFSHQLLITQENERSRLARELHDSLGQKLVLLKRRLLDNDATEGIELLADESIKELRSITKNLHPANLDLLGFSEAVKTMIDEVDKNTAIACSRSIEYVDDLLSKDRAIHLYRMIQESLNNMIKYSNAKTAEVKITKDAGAVIIEISDQGVGFDPNSETFNNGLGMKTLKERSKLIGSKLSIISGIGNGATVRISLPV